MVNKFTSAFENHLLRKTIKKTVDSQVSDSSTPIVFDVGYFQGSFTKKVLRSVKCVEIHAFDINGVSQQHKMKKCQNVIPIQRALSNSVGPKQSYTNGTYGLIQDHISKPKSNYTESGIIIGETIDNYASKNKIETIALLKVDTEGHDLHVLQGATKLLKDGRIGSILCEVSLSFSNKFHVHLKDLDEFLSQFDYIPTAFFDVARESDGIALRRADVFFCRK